MSRDKNCHWHCKQLLLFVLRRDKNGRKKLLQRQRESAQNHGMNTIQQTDIAEALTAELNQRLESSGMTVIQFTARVLADGCDRSIPTIRNWFSGYSVPGATDLVYIARVFGCTPNDLLVLPSAAVDQP